MSVQAVRFVRDLRGLHPAEKSVMFVIGEHANSHGMKSYCSVASIAEEAGVSDRTVQRVIQKMKNLGLLDYTERTTKTGKYTSHDYALPLETVTPIACEDRKKKLRRIRAHELKMERIARQHVTMSGHHVQKSDTMSPSPDTMSPSPMNHPLLTTHEPPSEPEKDFSIKTLGEITPIEKQEPPEPEIDVIALKEEFGL